MASRAFGDNASRFRIECDTCCAINCEEPSVIAAGATPMCEKHLISAYAAIGEYLRSMQEEPVPGTSWIDEHMKAWEPLHPPHLCPMCGSRLTRHREIGEVHCWNTKDCGWFNTAEEFVELAEARIAAELQHNEVVYYVRFGDRVKIGTTRDLTQRLTHIPHDEVMATEPGGVYVERQRHAQFKHLRTNVGTSREWFDLTPELAEHIAVVKSRMASAAS